MQVFAGQFYVNFMDFRKKKTTTDKHFYLRYFISLKIEKMEEIKWCGADRQLFNVVTKQGASSVQLIEVLRLGSLKSYVL